MVIASFLAVALKLGVLWFVLLLVLFQPPLERIPRLARITVLGMAICGPAGYFNTYWLSALQVQLGVTEQRVLASALMWILVAPVEELLKYAIVRSSIPRDLRLTHPREGCLLAACSALGFATYENYFYMTQAGYDVIHIRGWLCTAGHMLWSSIWGYYLGLALMGRAPARLAVAEGVMLAALAHGTYNFLCTTFKSGAAFLIPIGCVALLGQWASRRLWTGLHAPWFATLGRSGVPLRLLKFPDPDDATRAAAARLLTRFDDDEASERAAAAREAAGVNHQTILQELTKLERDTSPEVRAAAGASAERLRARLARIGISTEAD